MGVGNILLPLQRRYVLVTDLMTFALSGDVPAMLAALGPPLSAFTGWEPSLDKLSENVQRLLAFAESQGHVDALENAIRAATGIPSQPREVLPGAAAPRAEDVAIDQALKNDLVAVLKAFVTDSAELKQRAQRAFGNDVVADRVAWNEPIEKVRYQLVMEATTEGTLWRLVAGMYEQKPTNQAVIRFVRERFPMLYQDPVVRRTAVKWAVNGSIFESLLVGRRAPMVDRLPVRKVLSGLFKDPESAPSVLTVDGPARSGKSYLASLIEFLVDAGSRGHPQTLPHTRGQHRYALLRPLQLGGLHSVSEVAKDLFSQLGWMNFLPAQQKSDDGWAQEVLFELRNQLVLTDDIVWVVADRYWGFPQDKPIVDFIVGLVREATLMAGRDKLRLMLIDFPKEPLDRFILDNGAVEAQFEPLQINWLTPADVQDFCDAIAGVLPANPPLQAASLFSAVEAKVDQTRSGAELQRSWCTALKQELAPYW